MKKLLELIDKKAKKYTKWTHHFNTVGKDKIDIISVGVSIVIFAVCIVMSSIPFSLFLLEYMHPADEPIEFLWYLFISIFIGLVVSLILSILVAFFSYVLLIILSTLSLKAFTLIALATINLPIILIKSVLNVINRIVISLTNIFNGQKDSSVEIHKFNRHKLLKITEVLFSAKTQKDVFKPIMSDWDEEIFQALKQNKDAKLFAINLRNSFAFILAMWQKSPIGDFLEYVRKTAS